MFATEPVTASLASVLDEKDQQERAGGVGDRSSRYVVEDADGQGRRRRQVEIDELEIQKGLLQVGKGLEFLHESANLVHSNLTPDAIFINAKSDWKISGLGFCSPPDNATGASSVAPISLAEVLNYDARIPRSVQLNLDYSSPDFVIDTNITQSADMFSLGLIVIALYNSPHQSPIETSYSVSTYKRIFSTPSSIPTTNNNFHCSQNLPKDVKADLLPKLITRRPAQRYGAREFQQAQYFDNVLVSTMRFLDSLPAKTPNEKSQFMRGLPRILSQFPKSVLEKKILPALLEETKDPELLSLVLQNAFKTIDLVANSQRAVSEQIIPKLRTVFLSTTKKQQEQQSSSLKEGGIVVVLDNMSTIAKNCTAQQFKEDVLPVIFVGLESQTHSLVDHALQVLSVILPVLDFTTIKNELFPVVATVFAKTSSMAIKIQGLYALNVLCGGSNSAEPDRGDGLDGVMAQSKSTSTSSSTMLDKFTIQEKVVPLLKGIKTKEPAVMMAALSVFKQVGKVADSDFLALDVLPSLWSFSLGPLLNLQQFQDFMQLIKSLSSKIEHEQTRKLSELSNSTGAARRVGGNSFGGVGATNGITNDLSMNGEETDFESLVTGRSKNGGKSDDLFDGGWVVDTAARPANQRTASVQQASASAAPRFSWQTAPSPNLSNGMNTMASPSAGSGTITPDNAGSFAALTPSHSSTSMSSWGQPLQPQQPFQQQTPSFGTAPLQPSQPHRPAASIGGSSIDWSSANRRANTPMATMSPPATSVSTMGNMSRNQSFGHTGTTGGNTLSSFNIAPPPMSPTGMNVQMPARPTMPTSQSSGPKPKQGSEKYESLI